MEEVQAQCSENHVQPGVFAEDNHDQVPTEEGGEHTSKGKSSVEVTVDVSSFVDQDAKHLEQRVIIGRFQGQWFSRK